MSRFKIIAQTQEEEDAYDIAAQRHLPKPSGMVGTIANVIKGALGAGILSSHVAVMKAGYGVAFILTILLGCYLTLCLWILVKAGQVLCRRCQVPYMTYPDVGEAACSCSRNPKIRKCALPLRYCIAATIMMDLYGSCACYQLIVANSIKQLVEESRIGPGWSVRVYVAIMIIPFLIICLLRYLENLAKLSFVADLIIGLATLVTIYYAFVYNPKFENMVFFKDAHGLIAFCGMCVFSISGAGSTFAIENNMRNPHKITPSLIIGMSFITGGVAVTGFFGYVAFLEKCESPLTVNYPMTIFPKIIKISIIVMIYFTHALNFWAPFDTSFHYIKKCHNPDKLLIWEYFYRIIIGICVSLIALAVPSLDDLIGFLGVVVNTLMGFIWPQIISLLVYKERPGYGKLRWRLWRGIVLMIIGFFLFIAGSAIAIPDMINAIKGN